MDGPGNDCCDVDVGVLAEVIISGKSWNSLTKSKFIEIIGTLDVTNQKTIERHFGSAVNKVLSKRMTVYLYTPNTEAKKFFAEDGITFAIPDAYASLIGFESKTVLRNKLDIVLSGQSSCYNAKLINSGGRIKKSGQGKRFIMTLSNMDEDIKSLTYVTTANVHFDNDIQKNVKQEGVILRKWTVVYSFDESTNTYSMNVYSDQLATRLFYETWSNGVEINMNLLKN